MPKRRYEISDEQGQRIKDLLPGKKEDPGRTADDNRLFINAALWTPEPVDALGNRLKHYRRIATRYEKTARTYLSMVVYLASTMIWLL